VKSPRYLIFIIRLNKGRTHETNNIQKLVDAGLYPEKLFQ
jgi:hypothetical protein